jgi:hypothetical protein
LGLRRVAPFVQNVVKVLQSAAVRNLRDKLTAYHPDFQSVHLLMLVNSNARVEGVVVFPRNTEARQKWGGEYDTHANDEHLNPDVLSAFIESNAPNLIAF